MARGNSRWLEQLMQQMAQQAPRPQLPPGFRPGVPPMPRSGAVKESPSRLGKKRAIKDPKKAFGALGKLVKNMNPQQLKQLQQGMGNIFGQNFGGLGAGNKAAEAFDNMINEQHYYGPELGPGKGKHATARGIQNLLSQMGLTGPGGPGGPGINPPGPPPPPIGINPPPGQPPIGFPPGPPGVMGQPWQPSLNLGAVQGGAMGMAPQPQVNQPPTMRQTVQQQQFAKQQQGGASGAAAGGGPTATQTAAPKGVNDNLTATANTTPAVSSPNYATGTQFGAGAMTPGVTTGQLQGAITGSPLLNTGPATAGQIFQSQYNPMINTPGQADVMNQLSTPGRSNVMGQYGTGGLANTANQMAANQAAQQGIQGAQGLIAGNVQQQLGAQQMASQMDMAQRQQHLQHLTSMLGPAVSGAASGFNQAVQGMAGMPRFLG